MSRKSILLITPLLALGALALVFLKPTENLSGSLVTNGLETEGPEAQPFEFADLQSQIGAESAQHSIGDEGKESATGEASDPQVQESEIDIGSLIDRWSSEVGIPSADKAMQMAQMSDEEIQSLIDNGDLAAPQEKAYRLVRKGEGASALATLEESIARGSIGSARLLSHLHRIYTPEELESDLSRDIGAYAWHRVAVHMGDYSLAAFTNLDNAELALAEVETQRLIQSMQERQIELLGGLLPYNPHPPFPADEEDF